jgi:hypothetical protein
MLYFIFLRQKKFILTIFLNVTRITICYYFIHSEYFLPKATISGRYTFNLITKTYFLSAYFSEASKGLFLLVNGKIIGKSSTLGKLSDTQSLLYFTSIC